MIAEEHIEPYYYFRIKSTENEATAENGRFLFNQTYYLRHQCNLPLLSFELWNAHLSQTTALVHFSIHHTQAVSPLRATFGGIEVASTLAPELLDTFLEYMHVHLAARHITTIQLINHPFAYDTQAAQQVTAALLRYGYRISCADVNYHIAITQDPIELRMHASERRRLRKCRQAGFVFAEELTPDIAAIHAFIAGARLRKGFPMSLSLEAFRQLFANMPDIYRVFTIRKGDTLAALTVTVRINEHILYNFYPADNEAFLEYSPTVMLTVELYNLARKEGYTLLDLGIATAKGKPNYGLMRFKKNLGGDASLRLSFFKTVSQV